MNELRTGGQLFIVDNSDADWKVRSYLSDWCSLSSAIDIATGYFEIGALLALDGKWQTVDRIRLLMGDEVSLRTKNAFVAGLAKITAQLDGSVEAEKAQNDFLLGVPAIVEGLLSERIQCKVYRKHKFHAKAYLTHARAAVVGSFGLVGSSNFTFPGLAENIELNVQIRGPEVTLLQDWYERYWKEAEDVTPDILRTLERHVRDYTPFEVYAKALHQLFTRHELTANEWEKKQSALHPVLDEYQRDGYRSLIGIARQHGGALLCDGVGLGKTFVGLMLIERLVMFGKKRVVLLVPKSGRESVWERNIRRYLPQLLNGFLSFKVYNHTDLMRGVSADGRDLPDEFRQLKSQADVVLVDEAHHFRNRGLRPESGGSRYWNLYDLCKGKQVFLLTATPVNNHLTDFQHLIELFSRVDRPAAFAGAPLGIHSLPGHFKSLEKQLATIVGSAERGEVLDANQVEAEQVLFNDRLFRELVVQRSRAFVKKSQLQQGANEAQFPIKEPPRVAEYSVKKTYGHILGRVEVAFAKEKPLFALAPYYPLAYRSRYAVFLKIDFPRLPLTGNLELFRALARLGCELTALHLLESPTLDHPISDYVGGRAPEVEKISWSKNSVWLDKAETTGFRSVHENVWNFYIGGYKVCEKWLKDRKGRILTRDEITHYTRIIAALSETIRLMKTVDSVIEKRGGWPAAFASQFDSRALASTPNQPTTPVAKLDLGLQAENELPFSHE